MDSNPEISSCQPSPSPSDVISNAAMMSEQTDVSDQMSLLKGDSGSEMDIDSSSSRPTHKRKAEGDLSTNPNTVKARKRNEKISKDPIRQKIEKAKAADQGAVTYAKKQLLKSEAYLQASDDEKAVMVKNSEANVRLKRKRAGKDWKTVAEGLGFGEIGGLYATTDDGNAAWDDIEYESENEYEFEMRWKEDEKLNQEGEVEARDATDLKLSAYDRFQQSIRDKKALEFRTWQKKWRRSKRSLFRKNRKLSRGGVNALAKLDPPYTDRAGVNHPWKGPGKYFTIGEKAVWRNLASWAFDDEWVDLPGPDIWWPEDDKDIDATGFYFPDRKAGYKEAMEMVLAKEEPEGDLYQRVFPSHSDLRVMEDDSQTAMVLKAYFSL